MVNIPLQAKLKREIHRKIAYAQDLVVREVYSVFDKAVLHGGTAVWRCYSGNRISEDIDAYIPRNLEKINLFFENLEKKGFVIEKKKIGECSLYSGLKLNRTFVRFEALFKNVKGELKEYETIDGNLISVYTLLPEELIKEKINAYLARLKVRDIYDVFFLLKYVKDKDKIKKELGKLILNFKNPIDEKELKVLITEGIIPNAEEIVRYIKREI